MWRRWERISAACSRTLRSAAWRARAARARKSPGRWPGPTVERPVVAETTALGAAYLAGLAVGFWRDAAELEGHWRLDRRFEPAMAADVRERLHAGWRRAVERARGWIEA